MKYLASFTAVFLTVFLMILYGFSEEIRVETGGSEIAVYSIGENLWNKELPGEVSLLNRTDREIIIYYTEKKEEWKKTGSVGVLASLEPDTGKEKWRQEFYYRIGAYGGKPFPDKPVFMNERKSACGKQRNGSA